MKRKHKIFLFIFEIFYGPLRIFYTSCQLDRVWMIQTFKNSRCKPSYCDTPEAIILRMITRYRDIVTYYKLPRPMYLKMLEPSFGTGQIVKFLSEFMRDYLNLSITGYEHSQMNFCKTIQTLGYTDGCPPVFTRGVFRLFNFNFLKYDGEDRYNAIFMVPPYPNREFIVHVKHAAGLLADNGVLTAIIPEAIFESNSWAAIKFRMWLKRYSYDVLSLGPVVCNYPVSVVIITLVNRPAVQDDPFESELHHGFSTMS